MKNTSCIIFIVAVVFLFVQSHARSLSTRTLIKEALSSHSQALGQDSLLKRDLPTCPVVTCAANGQPCDSIVPCENCLQAFQNCSAGFTNSCSCYTAAWRCFNATPSCYSYKNMLRATCNATSFTTENCSCDVEAPETTNISCYSTNFCNQTSALCQLKHTSGTCDGNYLFTDECGDPNAATPRGYQCTQITGTSYFCESVKGWALPNDICTTSYDCFGNTLTCPSGGGLCSSTPVGGDCSDSDQCAPKTWCDLFNGTCVPQSTSGQTCDPQDTNSCISGTVCNVTGTCVPLFSAASGALCNNLTEFECTYGLLCINSTCQTPPPLRACQSDTDCAFEGATCGCELSGTRACEPTVAAIPSSCANAFQSAITCQLNSDCKEISDDPSSCMTKNCPYQTSCLFSCIYTQSLLPVVQTFTCQQYPNFQCLVATTGVAGTLLTGSPLPTLPKPYGQNAAVPIAISSWLAAILAALLFLW